MDIGTAKGVGIERGSQEEANHLGDHFEKPNKTIWVVTKMGNPL